MGGGFYCILRLLRRKAGKVEAAELNGIIKRDRIHVPGMA